MNKKNYRFFLFIVLQLFSSGISAQPKDSATIKECYVPLPLWWNEVTVNLPDSITSLNLLQDYCTPLKNDSSSGNEIFIKTMYVGLQKLNIFPAYLGDAYFEIGSYDEAITVYKNILPCAVNEKGRSDEWECYLYYMIGKCYEEKKEKDDALEWYRKAIDPRFEKGNNATIKRYEIALCAYRCLMNIRCDN